jgi:hypothetical protein
VSAVARLRASECQAHSDQNELDAFRSESETAPPASAQPCLFVSVPAYPARALHPPSSARCSSPGSPAHVSTVAVGPRVMTSVRRKVRWIALAPVRLRAAGFAAIGRAVYAVAALAGRMVPGAVRGVMALGRNVASAFVFVVRACVHAVRAGLAMVGTAVTRTLLAVAAIVDEIVGAAVGAAGQLLAGHQAVERGLTAAFASVRNRAARASCAAVSNGVSAMAAGRRASVSRMNSLTARATTSAQWLRREAARHAEAWRPRQLWFRAASGETLAALAGRRATPAFHHVALVVVVALVGAAVTAGGALQWWRGPVVPPVAAVMRVEASAEPVVVPVAAAVTPPPVTHARPVTRRADAGSAAEPRRGLSAETVRAIWRKTDTRSLDRGIAAVRTATLALHRCRVEMTASDRAVARCDVRPAATSSSRQPRKAAWTIDFRRADERWLIEDISTAAR